MSGLTMIVFVAFNVGLIFLLLAAPLGKRILTVKRRMKAPRERLWHALFPLGEQVGWSGEVLQAAQAGSETDQVRLSMALEGRDGHPITRLIQLHDVVPGEQFAFTVLDDSSLDIAFWEHFRKSTTLQEAGDSTEVEISQADRYRGLAFMMYRYFRLRRELDQLTNWVQNGCFEKRAVFEHPVTQTGLAVVSALVIWPLFGLNGMGLLLAGILTLVVALHELGHMAAFRVTGHKSARMIFIPVLGGIAIGGRPYDRRFEVAFVALMGAGFSAFLVPVSITASVWANAWDYPFAAEVFASFAAFCAFFNLANLVPVWKFDGGQVLRQLCENRVALALSSFALLAVFLAFGYGAGIPIGALLVAGGVVVVLSLITAGRGVKPKHELTPLVPAERAALAAGLVAVFTIHGLGVMWAAGNFL